MPMSTMTAQRRCARTLSIAYYFVIVPFVYDLFMSGADLRSAYQFPFVLLAVSGLQIGYKENDAWVRGWFWTNLVYLATLTCLAFFYPPFPAWVRLTTYEPWMLFAAMAITILALPVNRFLPHTSMKVYDGDEDPDDDFQPETNQNPAQ